MASMKRLVRDTRAVSLVEFALISPVMITMMFGSFTAYHLARASMRLWSVTQSIGDLVSQQTTLTVAKMSDICTSASLSLVPFSGTLSAAVASVTQSSTGTTAVDWQDVTCGGASTISNALALGTAYDPNIKDSVIVVKSIYVYKFPPSYVLPSSITLTRVTYSRPRSGTQVAHS